MTTRTPPTQYRSTYNIGVNENTKNPNDYNNYNTQQFGQSAKGIDKPSNPNEENNSTDRVYIQTYTDNNSAVFDLERYFYPKPRKEDKPEEKKPELNKAPEDKTKQGVEQRAPEPDRKESYTAVERETKAVDARADAINTKLDELGTNYKGIPTRFGEVEGDMASNGYKVNELEMRNKLHSAKIHELERELKNVRMENNYIKGHLAQDASSHPQQYGAPQGTYGQPPAVDPRSDPYQQSYTNQGYPGAKEMGRNRNEDLNAKRVYKNEQHHINHGYGEKDGEEYWGFNKYYNPQYSTSYRREHIPYLAKLEEKEHTQQQPGGLYIIRFHNSGADEVNVSLKEQQSIIKSFNGHVLGIATKDQVLVLEGDADWRFARSQGNQDRRRAVLDGIAVLWFPNRSKAFDFFSNSFRNRFKQQGFPTPHGWEGHFIPMKMPIMYKSLNTYLILEVLNAAKYSKDQLEFFEMKTREAIMNAYPNSMPLVSAAFRDREAFRPGPLFKDRSVVYISRFSSMNNACEAWESGTISRWLTEAGITGPINVSVFGLSEWVDY